MPSFLWIPYSSDLEVSCDLAWYVRTYIMREEKSPGLTKSFHFNWVLLYVIISISSLQILNEWANPHYTVICCQGVIRWTLSPSGQLPNVHLLKLLLGFREKKNPENIARKLLPAFNICWKMRGERLPALRNTGYYSRHRLYQKKNARRINSPPPSRFFGLFPEFLRRWKNRFLL